MDDAPGAAYDARNLGPSPNPMRSHRVRRRSSLAIGATLALVIVPLVVVPASAGSQRDAVIAYWTPARIAAAKPRDLKPLGHMNANRGKPGGGGAGAVGGASWANGGAVLDQTGKVFFHMGGGDWQCSGSVVSDGGRAGYSIVLTAGHCAIDETTGEFASNWVFMPNWDTQPATFTTACTGTLYGCWTTAGGGGIYVHWGFAHAGAFNNQAVTHDWAFAVVGPGGKSNAQLDAAKGSGGVGTGYAIQFSGVSSGNRLEAFGYPAAGKYHGNDLTWCAGNIAVDVASSNGSTNNATWGMACDMTGGSSGGPWFANLNETNGSGGTLSSLNSYGYSGVVKMFGPKFNANTLATFNAAKSGTPTNTVVGTAP